MLNIQELARTGAKIRLAQLEGERKEIQAFIAKMESGTKPGPTVAKIRKIVAKRRSMSPSARLEVSKRMKKYWADWRKAAKSKK